MQVKIVQNGIIKIKYDVVVNAASTVFRTGGVNCLGKSNNLLECID